MHDETVIPPIREHLQLHASQYKQKTQHSSHPLHKHTTYFNTPRLKILYSVITTYIKTNSLHTHTSIVFRHLATRGNNKILRTPPPHISSSGEILPRLTRRILAQLRTNKSPFLKSYLQKATQNHIHHHYQHHLDTVSLICVCVPVWSVHLSKLTIRNKHWLIQLNNIYQIVMTF